MARKGLRLGKLQSDFRFFSWAEAKSPPIQAIVWKNRKEHLTPNYLTDIEQIMTVRI